MKIRVEFLKTHESDVYDVGRVPCVGERVATSFDANEAREVKEVTHILNADPATKVLAIVRVW